jgi:hypothetical protein
MQNIYQILTLKKNIFHKLEKNRRLFSTAFLNLFILGLLSGYVNVANTRTLLEAELSGGFETPGLAIMVFGYLIFFSISQIFLTHAGFSLLLWAMGMGLRGKATFLSVYLHSGAAVPPLWLGLPMLLMYFGAVATGQFILYLGILSMAWGFATITNSVMDSQNFSWRQSVAVLSITIIFIISFLILWGKI